MEEDPSALFHFGFFIDACEPGELICFQRLRAFNFSGGAHPAAREFVSKRFPSSAQANPEQMRPVLLTS